MPRLSVFDDYIPAMWRDRAARELYRSIDNDIMRLYPEPSSDDDYSVSVDTAAVRVDVTPHDAFAAHRRPRGVVLNESSRITVCEKCGGTGIIQMRKRNDWSSLVGVARMMPNNNYPCDVCNRDDSRGMML